MSRSQRSLSGGVQNPERNSIKSSTQNLISSISNNTTAISLKDIQLKSLTSSTTPFSAGVAVANSIGSIINTARLSTNNPSLFANINMAGCMGTPLISSTPLISGTPLVPGTPLIPGTPRNQSFGTPLLANRLQQVVAQQHVTNNVTSVKVSEETQAAGIGINY